MRDAEALGHVLQPVKREDKEIHSLAVRDMARDIENYTISRKRRSYA